MSGVGDAADKAGLKKYERPAINDPNLKLEIAYQGNYIPGLRELNQFTPVTQFAFLGNDDILILSKNDGKVLRVLNHKLLSEPLLDVNVTNQWESGLLGITISKDADKVYVFLYYTESTSGDGNASSTEPSYNKLYRYELINNKLKNPKLLFTAPTPNRYSHIGGGLQIGPDNNLYLTVGDMHGDQNKSTTTMAQNFNDGVIPDGRAGMLRFTQDGEPVGSGILGKKYPLNLYYAYGIRNSFGLDFDPVSGKIWDTENGPQSGDEINLVEPGFNSGWNKIQGKGSLYQNLSSLGKVVLDLPDGLVDFGGKGKYRAPEFVWKQRVAPTALKFLNSEQLGKRYQNDLFVASFNLGEIYDFDLNENRSKLELTNTTTNKTLAKKLEVRNVLFAHGLGKITDMDVGQDGNLYVLSKYLETPTIFKISSVNKTK
jgi:aldose sugar dehydrogenase